MSRPSNRDKILTEGMRVVHERGFAGASVRDIVAAAGVPQGSFTNHFASKEAFGVEVIDLYLARALAAMDDTLRNQALTPLRRLDAYIDAARDRLSRRDMRNGCLFGNFTAEASDHSETIRHRLVEVFGEIEREVADCLRAAVAVGELPAAFDCADAAAFIVASMQGANLLAKAQRSPAPIERFKRLLFANILR